MNKLVSVIMCIYNEEVFILKQSINSILNQTYKNFEFLIIDDGSSQETKLYLDLIKNKDSRIKIIAHNENIGLTKSLNEALKLVKGEYIIRMDGDDISLPKRIEKQVRFLNENQDIDIVGTQVISFDKEISYVSTSKALSNNMVNAKLFFTSSLCHPSVAIRTKFLLDNNLLYDEFFTKTQDYDLWERSSKVGKLAVMKDVLLLYRIHNFQISNLGSAEQRFYADMIIKRRLGRLGLNPSNVQENCHLALKGVKLYSIKATSDWVNVLLDANKQYNLVNQECLKNELSERLALLKIKTVLGKRNILNCEFNTKDLYYLIHYIYHRLIAYIKLEYYKLFYIKRLTKVGEGRYE